MKKLQLAKLGSKLAKSLADPILAGQEVTAAKAGNLDRRPITRVLVNSRNGGFTLNRDES